MVLFTNPVDERLDVPEDVTVWDWLFEAPKTPSDAPARTLSGAYVDAKTTERISFAQVKTLSTGLSTALIKSYGLKAGETVSIFSGNSVWYPVTLFATVRAGARIHGSASAFTVTEMVHAMRVAQSKIVFAEPSGITRAAEAAALAGIPKRNVLLTHGSMDGFSTIQQLIEEAKSITPAPPFQLPAGSTNKDVCGFLNLSSGTTGLPKAVMLSHHNLMASCYMARTTELAVEDFKALAVLPFVHIAGTYRLIFSVFMDGLCVVLPKFSMQDMLDAVVKYRIEEITAVPPILVKLTRDDIVQKYDLSHVKRLGCGSAPLAPNVIASLQQQFPWMILRQAYGSTEGTPVASLHPSRTTWETCDAVGEPTCGTTIKILDAEGRELGVGEAGEVVVKSPVVAMGYLNNPEATAASFDADGYYHTGDLGYFNANGLLYITDRIKELIKVKAHQVAPAELEDLLLGHEWVADCAVTSIPDQYAGELPKAFVVLKPGVAASEEVRQALFDHIKTRCVRYKWLSEIEFTTAIPKSAAGKILRRLLKTQGIKTEAPVTETAKKEDPRIETPKTEAAQAVSPRTEMLKHETIVKEESLHSDQTASEKGSLQRYTGKARTWWAGIRRNVQIILGC